MQLLTMQMHRVTSSVAEKNDSRTKKCVLKEDAAKSYLWEVNRWHRLELSNLKRKMTEGGLALFPLSATWRAPSLMTFFRNRIVRTFWDYLYQNPHNLRFCSGLSDT